MRKLVIACLGLVLIPFVASADPPADAQKAFDQKQYAKAVQLLDAHIQTNPTDHKAYLLRGRSHYGLVNVNEAKADYTKAIELNPTWSTPYSYRGKLYAANPLTWNEALADFDKCIEYNPKANLTRIARGELHLKNPKGPDFDKAFADFDAAVKQDPKSAAAYAGRGQATLGRGAVWAQSSSQNTVVVYIRGYSAEAARKSLPDFDKAVELSPRSADYRRFRISCHEGLQDVANGIADRKAVAELVPTDADNFNRLAWILATTRDERYRDPKAAVEAAKRANELARGTNGKVLDTLAAAHAAAGDFAEAVAVQRRAIELLGARPGSVFHERLDLYTNKQPYRMPPPPAPAGGVPPKT